MVYNQHYTYAESTFSSCEEFDEEDSCPSEPPPDYGIPDGPGASTQMVRTRCGRDKYETGSDYHKLLEHIIEQIKQEAHLRWTEVGKDRQMPYNINSNNIIYGRAACRSTITMTNRRACEYCIRMLADELHLKLCRNRTRGYLYSNDCFVRYCDSVPPPERTPWHMFVG